ncbi:unnamed protein product [Ceratitis capitata]|uniref:(Mediterranean fruit fly) hypothetical protein n=1 Tax=Ceratitis capitata TaxID=7213 RepID=A0A811UBR5_CERCA|nr:unnamed protein product [Ceratitis capitata]
MRKYVDTSKISPSSVDRLKMEKGKISKDSKMSSKRIKNVFHTCFRTCDTGVYRYQYHTVYGHQRAEQISPICKINKPFAIEIELIQTKTQCYREPNGETPAIDQEYYRVLSALPLQGKKGVNG